MPEFRMPIPLDGFGIPVIANTHISLDGFVDMPEMKTVVRVAGGWVRDKCLAKDSDDIDIAVDDMN
eukprot:69394-Amorphochlora_amoeboformis.AAC.1